MKLLLSLSLGLASFAGAFEIPKGSHHLGQMDDVAKMAAKDKQPIAWVISSKKMAAT
ncbi:hypothetical protein N9165_02390 [Akkermansiaceae bacterium]|nr:hypothetical protein [Akkermansiaceae bacterium]MDB4507949.1 hypothetical protein [Akkermansiaceae bacterium]